MGGRVKPCHDALAGAIAARCAHARPDFLLGCFLLGVVRVFLRRCPEQQREIPSALVARGQCRMFGIVDLHWIDDGNLQVRRA